MDYSPGHEIPVRPARHKQSWKYVAMRMTSVYLVEKGCDSPRHYTEENVSARWNNDIRPRLLAATNVPIIHIEVPSPPREGTPPPYEEEALPRYEETRGRAERTEKEC
jgi:hypothetical protein